MSAEEYPDFSITCLSLIFSLKKTHHGITPAGKGERPIVK